MIIPLLSNHIRNYLVHVVFLVGLELEAAGHILFDVEGVLRVGVGEVFVVGMLRYVVLVAQEGSQAADLEDALAAVEGGKVVHAHELFATMSSDEFKNGQKNNPPRLRGGKCYFKCSYLTIIFSLGLQIGFIHNTTVSGSTSYSQASILASTIIPISQA